MHIGTDIDETRMAAFIQAGIDSAENEGTLSQDEVEAWFANRRQQRPAPE